MHLNRDVVLASRSPRRHRLLRQIGLDYSVHISHVNESIPGGIEPWKAVEEIAMRKAVAVAARYPGAITIGADTIVVLDGDILNKPASESDAVKMLGRLSGRTHTVITGIAVVAPEERLRVAEHETTLVTFAELSTEEIEAYVRTGSPLDKAGAYGIQGDLGAVFVSRIEGDYYNVVGLPLHRLYRILKQHFAVRLQTA